MSTSSATPPLNNQYQGIHRGETLVGDWLAVTPSDTVDIIPQPNALWIGVTGDLTVMSVNDNLATFKAVPVGWFPGRAKRVMATGTTASSIVAAM